MKYSPGLQDIEPLASCSGNETKTVLKGHLSIKCLAQKYQGTQIHSDQFRQELMEATVDCRFIVRDLEIIIVLELLAFNLFPYRSRHSITIKITNQALCHATLPSGNGTIATKVE